MKDKNMALKAAGVIFLLVAIMHLLRVLFKVRLSVAGHPVQMYVSWIGFLVALLMGIWMYVASKR